ncbi:hypothetical protein [Reyranella sp.]|uniref:hypothetical protein n=1 Tax=Reyranella sp. TaxID=1929291 RepID=UPI004036DFD4
MRRALLVLIGLLAPVPSAFAQAHPLQGTWVVRLPTGPKYVGIVLVDGEGRTTFDSPQDWGRPAKFVGYVARMNGLDTQFHLTDKAAVIHMNCVAESAELLSCQVAHKDVGGTSKPFALVRVGPGPRKLSEANL